MWGDLNLYTVLPTQGFDGAISRMGGVTDADAVRRGSTIGTRTPARFPDHSWPWLLRSLIAINNRKNGNPHLSYMPRQFAEHR